MEELLHYTWETRLFPLKELKTTDGREVEVIDVGWHNKDAGPDFLNSKIRIGGILWVGNVEIHIKASEWYHHQHEKDKAYENVILHVVCENDKHVNTLSGRTVPQLVLPIPTYVKNNYKKLISKQAQPPCYKSIASLEKIERTSIMSSMFAERIEEKTENIKQLWRETQNNWEKTFFITLARAFGFGINAEAFFYWAKHLPFNALGKHRNEIIQVEAIFFGYAGMLENDDGDNYYIRLKKEFNFLCHKFNLNLPKSLPVWKMLRLRPYNFPQLRIAQLAYMYHHNYNLMSTLCNIKSLQELKEYINLNTSDYWKQHFTFDNKAERNTSRKASQQTIELIMINAILPFSMLYSKYNNDEKRYRELLELWEELPYENNNIVRKWKKIGLIPKSAADSQGILHLEKQYCRKRDCLRCNIGYKYLKNAKE